LTQRSPFQRPGESPQKTGGRFETYFAKFFGQKPVKGSGNQWHAPLDVGSIKILFNLKWSSKDLLRFGKYQIHDLFIETQEAVKSSDKTGALVIHEETTGKTYTIFEGTDFMRMAQTGDIHYMTPSKGDQKRAQSRVPALLRDSDD
jgi:hypothetical protein